MTISAGIIYGIGIRSNAKKAGVMAEILAVNDFTPIGLKESEVYRNASILVKAGVYLNFSH